MRLARIVHAADIDDEIHTDALAPGLLAIGLGGLDVEADDHRLLERASFVYDALYAWCAQQVSVDGAGAIMTSSTSTTTASAPTRSSKPPS